jgi:hypothetical protein
MNRRVVVHERAEEVEEHESGDRCPPSETCDQCHVTNVAERRLGVAIHRTRSSKYAFCRRPHRAGGDVSLRRRWWLFSAATGNPLVRSVDRAEGWLAAAFLAAVIGAVPISVDFSQMVQASETKAIEAAAATRHSVDAVAMAPSETRSQGAATTYWTHLQWFDTSAKHERTVKVPAPMRSGDRTLVWVDNSGNLTSAPRTQADARAGGVGAGLMLWFVIAALAAGALRTMRRCLDRLRDRLWERDLHVLVGNGGGSTAHNT